MARDEWVKKAKNLIEQAQEEIANLSRLGVATVNVSFLEREKDQILVSLGALTFEMVKEGLIKSSRLERLVERIENVDKKIVSLKLEKKEASSRLRLK